MRSVVRLLRTTCLFSAALLVIGCSGEVAPAVNGMQGATQGGVLSVAAWDAEPPPPSATGLRMYRDGLGGDGAPLTAIVAGDVPIEGTQFSCTSCHGRSGMGATEGAYVVPPIAGPFLFSESPQPARPAYTTQSLARVLREGVTPGGRNLNALMPRYVLEDSEVASLSAYLQELSAENSSGVDAEQIHFATVISDDVADVDRDGVLSVLRRYVDEKNRQTRLESERWDRGYTPESRLPTVYREWVLHEWNLSGPTESWQAQLEQKYAEMPVFAMLSGLSGQSWSPIAEFCERNEIPCLFPSADYPEADRDDVYSFYFSAGATLEADLIAAHAAAAQQTHVMQIQCANQPAFPSVRLEERLGSASIASAINEVDCTSPLRADTLPLVEGSGRPTALVLWLNRLRLAELDSLQFDGAVYIASSMLDAQLDEPLPLIGSQQFVAHTQRLAGQVDPAFLRFSVWAKTRNIELISPRRQAEAFFASLALKDAVKHIGRFFIRDYVLDMLEHADGLAPYVSYYPRPTFGPGQRFLSKGGYVLRVENGVVETDGAQWLAP